MISKIKIEDKTDEQKIEELHDFYDAYYNQEVKIRFNKLKVLRLLRQLGYIWYVPETTDEAKKGMIIHIKNNRIRIKDIANAQTGMKMYIRSLPERKKEFARKTIGEDGKPDVTKYIYTITPEFLEAKFLDNLSNLFGGDLMYHLRVDEEEGLLKMQEDTVDEKYIYFNNKVLRVTKNGTEEISYDDLTGYVWENNILNRDFEYTEQVGDFEKFIGDICGYDPTNANKQQLMTGKQRKRSLMSILGYLMHNNYECDRKALVFTDVNDIDADESNGRTGKGILGKALCQMINRRKSDCRYLVVPGKGFEFKDTRYSAGDISTQLIHIEDANANTFDFELFFCDVTDGCLFRKLHQNPTIHDCKMMISVNHTIDVMNSESKMGRVCIFELTNYYRSDYTPEMKYGRRFFESKWTNDDWMQFYSFMVRCCETYMKYGLIKPDMVNYANRLLEESLPEDFRFFLEYQINPYLKHKDRFEINKNEFYGKLVEKYHDFARYSQKKISTMCIRYFKLRQIPSAQVRTTRDGTYIDLFVLHPNAADNVYKWIYRKSDKQEDMQQDMNFEE